MLCDMCKKVNATVHLTEIVDEQATELHLCEDCARKKSSEMEQHFGLSDLLAGLADFGKAIPEEKELNKKCPNCGLTYADFKKIGRLGCSECYSAFRKNLEPLLRRIHGSSQHIGKTPGKTKIISSKTAVTKLTKEECPSLEQLKEKLQLAIQKEEFEEAAKLRDEIRNFEKKEKQSKE